MILIADSGSSKTDWRLIIHRKKVIKIETIGLNPYFINESIIIKEINEKIKPAIGDYQVNNLFFYGAGCGSIDNCNMLKKVFEYAFEDAFVSVNTDIIAAARAVCGNESGVVGILGTGSNVCFYNGEIISEIYPSLGFVLGDEGGGAYIVKKFLKELLSGKLENSIELEFYSKFSTNPSKIVNDLYKNETPNRFLASFIPFILENINNDAIEKIVEDSFHDYFNYQISRISYYKTLKLNFVGSIAYYFKTQLTKVAHCWNCDINKIIRKPIESLIDYHIIEKEEF